MNMLKTIAIVPALGLLLAGCANTYDPGQRALGGGAIGAGAGAILGGVAGGGRGALAGALIGGAVGAVGGLATTPQAPPQPDYRGSPSYTPPNYPQPSSGPYRY